jgi:outer membrane protein assembly factor BamE (lipoprotein component of BamABCDE complex)
MKLYPIYLMMLVVVFGCKYEINTTKTTNKRRSLQKVYTQNALDKILYKGMPKEEVIRILGTPSNGNSFGIVYDFQPSKIKIEKDGHFSPGIFIQLDDDKVVIWSLIRGYFPPMRSKELEPVSEK